MTRCHRAAALLTLLSICVACSDEGGASSMAPAMTEPAAGASGATQNSAGAPNATGPAATSGSSAGARSPGAANASGSGSAGMSGTSSPADAPANAGRLGPGMCCPDGKCLCRGDAPTALTTAPGPYKPMQYAIDGKGCVYYPTDAQPPFAAVAISDGFGGSGGCDSVQTNEWGPFYASHGIVAMIIQTGTGDQPNARGQALLDSLAALKAENDRADSPLHGNLAGRYGTSGFSNGGGGTTYAAASDKTLLTSIAVMPWGFADGGSVPTLIICGANDSIAPCESYGTPGYAKIDDGTPKMRVTVMSEYDGQPSAGMGSSGAYALAFQKVFLEGDPRWRALLVAAKSDATTIH